MTDFCDVRIFLCTIPTNMSWSFLGLACSEKVATTIGDMDDTNSLPNDLTQCHQLLLAAFRQSVQLEQQAAEALQRAAESEQQVAELNRVLGETAASFEELKQEHASTCGPNTLAVTARTASLRLRCRHGRFQAALPGPPWSRK